MRVNNIFESCSHPIPKKDDLVIVIVPPTNVGLQWAMDDQRTLKKVALAWKEFVKSQATYEKSIRHRITHVRVIPVCTILVRNFELIRKRRFGRYGALGNSWNTIGPVGTILKHAIWIVSQWMG